MKKITLLLFSHDDAANAIGLIKEMYPFVDEIVNIDSSEEKQHAMLLREKKARNLTKLRIYKNISLSIIELFKPYAIGLCKGDWILSIDTDERLNEEFKRDLHSIVASSALDAYWIRRWEYVVNNIHKGFTWQAKLFRKDRMRFTGILHAQGEVDGKIGYIDERYYIDHREDLKVHGRGRDYLKMEIFYRFSYAHYNKIMLENVSRYGTKARHLVRLLTAYERLTLRKPDDELSTFDYFVYFFMHDIAHTMLLKRYGSLFPVALQAYRKARDIGSIRHTPEGMENFEIAKIIYNIGIIKFLELDKPEVVKRLQREYEGKEQNTPLLIALLRAKYRSQLGTGSQASAKDKRNKKLQALGEERGVE